MGTEDHQQQQANSSLTRLSNSSRVEVIFPSNGILDLPFFKYQQT
jgi:hypothetical protein